MLLRNSPHVGVMLPPDARMERTNFRSLFSIDLVDEAMIAEIFLDERSRVLMGLSEYVLCIAGSG